MSAAVAAVAGDACPPPDCALCPRLAATRRQWRSAEPAWHNAPVPSFGALDASVLIVGLAPGLRGANRTGRPFTGDGAGDTLFPALLASGFAAGTYGRTGDDGLTLIDCRITNAVRCVPPGNRPTPEEIRTCNRFLVAELGGLASLAVILALGAVAHRAVLCAFDLKPASAVFAHGACHVIPGNITLIDSYHCSRQNTNTGRLTPAMFEAVLAEVKARSHRSPAA